MKRAGQAACIAPMVPAPFLGRDGPRRVLLGDSLAGRARRLEGELQALGREVLVRHDCKEVIEAARGWEPDLVVVELRLGPAWNSVLKAIPKLRDSCQGMVVVITCHESVATAVEALRRGAHAYLAKPTTAHEILDAACGDGPASELPQSSFLTLDRAMWEYVHSVLVAAQSLSKAAEQLGIDKRSLRRMLNKYAP